MGSKTPPRIFYDPALRSTVEQAFDATWPVLRVRDPLRDFEQDYELKTALSRKLMGLAEDGVTDGVECDRAFGGQQHPGVAHPVVVQANAPGQGGDVGHLHHEARCSSRPSPGCQAPGGMRPGST